MCLLATNAAVVENLAAASVLGDFPAPATSAPLEMVLLDSPLDRACVNVSEVDPWLSTKRAGYCFVWVLLAPFVAAVETDWVVAVRQGNLLLALAADHAFPAMSFLLHH
jgi:hypothetical protein